MKSTRRGKSAVDPAPKRGGNKSIFSFFNAATQRQQGSQHPHRSASPDKQPVSHDDSGEDILDDISGDEASVPFSKGSQIASAVRKRKLRSDAFDLVPEEADPLPATSKFRKVTDGGRASARSIVEDGRPWTDQFAPADLSELAVHKKKVQDVRGLLESSLSEKARPRLIVLKGAAGTAKTTTVNLLARDLGAGIMEWKNPAGADAAYGVYVSASAQFEDFVMRSAQYTGLQLVTGDGAAQNTAAREDGDGRPQIMLVEEFPNTFTRASTALQSFRSTIQQFLATPRSFAVQPTPLVMVISETLLSTSTAAADSFTAHRLLGPQILTHPQTAVVEFNPVATTILTKALETIVIKEARKSGRRKTPGPRVLKRLAETGDIRSAVSSLEFLCLRGDEGDVWSAKVAFTKPKGAAAKKDTPLTQQEQDVLKLISNRESSLGIFHAVGKVVYNKRQEPPLPSELPQPPNFLPQHKRPKIPEVDVDALINELGTDTGTFIAALHENYALSCNSSSSEDALDSLSGCLDALSDSDLLSLDRFGIGTRAYAGSAQDNLRQDDMSFQVAVRGLLFALPSPVRRGEGAGAGKRGGTAFHMFYPSSLRIWKRREELQGTFDLVVASLQSETSNISSRVVGGEKKEKVGVVEGWKRGSDFSNVDKGNDASSTPSSASDAKYDDASSSMLPLLSLGMSAKTELLLDRLPYAARILARRAHVPTSLLINISTLTSLQGSNAIPADLQGEEDLGADDDQGLERALGLLGPLPSSEWTDAPDADAEPPLRRPERVGQGGRARRTAGIGTGYMGNGVEREGGGLGIPVEHAVERLVLSDDDIVDE